MKQKELIMKLDKVEDWCAGCEQFDCLASGTIDNIVKIINQHVAEEKRALLEDLANIKLGQMSFKKLRRKQA